MTRLRLALVAVLCVAAAPAAAQPRQKPRVVVLVGIGNEPGFPGADAGALPASQPAAFEDEA
jgi:hypothetical protein